MVILVQLGSGYEYKILKLCLLELFRVKIRFWI